MIENLRNAELVSQIPTTSRADLAALGFLARYGVPHTRNVYATALRQWFQFCESNGIDPLDAGRAHIEIWARLLEDKGLRPSTVAGKLNALAGFYRYAGADRLIEHNPMDHVRRPAVERVSTTNGLSRTELADILKAAAESSPQDHALMSVLGYNGLRISEVLNMNIEHISTERGRTVVHITRKGSKSQRIPLTYETAYAFQQLIGDRTEGPIFHSREGNRLDRKGASRIVKRLAAKIGITRRVHPHSLRHTFVTLARDEGVADRDIIAATGHADGRMVEYYDRHRDSIERSATAIDSLAAFVGRAR